MRQDRDFILSRSRSSPRVQDLLAVAIQVTSFRILNYRVSIDHARQWARNMTVSEVLEVLRRRLQIKRIGRYGSISKEQQDELVNYEVTLGTLEIPGAPLDKVAKIRAAVHRIEDIKTKEQRVWRKGQEIKALVRRMETQEPKLRHFLRKADRLWRIQLNRVKSEIFDGQIQNDTIHALLGIYEKYYQEAAKVCRD